MHVYEVRPRKDKRGIDLISDALPFGRLWYAEPSAIANAIDYAKHRSRSQRAVIRVYDDAGNVIETHHHVGDPQSYEFFPSAALLKPVPESKVIRELGVCHQCNQRPATTIAAFRIGRSHITAELCDCCSQSPRPQGILDKRIAELGAPTKAAREPQIFVVVEIYQPDDYRDEYYHQPLRSPIAAFIHQGHADEFVARERRKQALDTTWEIIPVAVADLGTIFRPSLNH